MQINSKNSKFEAKSFFCKKRKKNEKGSRQRDTRTSREGFLSGFGVSVFITKRVGTLSPNNTQSYTGTWLVVVLGARAKLLV
jgi:hypothetical protein